MTPSENKIRIVKAAAQAMQESRFLDAAAAYSEAIGCGLDDGCIWDKAGQAWYELRRFDAARACWERAARVDTLSPASFRQSSIADAVTTGFLPDFSIHIENSNHSTFPDIAQLVPDKTHRANLVFTLGPLWRRKALLTIDDGPSPDITPVILEALNEVDTKAMFFLIGSSVERFPSLVDAILESGHSVHNHSWSHTPFTMLSKSEIVEELERTEEALDRHRGRSDSTIVRMPGGAGWNEPTVHEAVRSWRHEAIILHWSVDTLDWRCSRQFRTSAEIDIDARARVLESLFTPTLSGPIILAHDLMLGVEPRSPAFAGRFYRLLPTIYRNAGFSFVLPDEIDFPKPDWILYS